MPDAHSKYSASASDRWLACPGSIVLSQGKPDTSSSYAEWGTAAHTVAEWTLREGEPTAQVYLGRRVTVGLKTIEVTAEMVEVVDTYVNNVREMTTGALFIAYEQKLNYSAALGVPEDEGWGTGDTVAIVGDELQAHDMKTGYNRVEAADNSQLMLYALGALDKFAALVDEDIKHVRLVIHQPRVQAAPIEHRITVEELETFRRRAMSGAASVRNAEALAAMPGGIEATWLKTFTEPGSHCRYCKAQATCPRLRDEVVETVFAATVAEPEEFADLTVPGKEHIQPAGGAWLGAAYAKLDMIEGWCKSVLAEIERRLLAGGSVPGTKIVQGKRGNRAWSDAAKAEEALKKFRLKQEVMYDFSLKSPTQIALLGPKFDKEGKVVPPKEGKPEPLIGPRQWPKIAELIVQAEGKLHVAPASDPRPAVDVKPVEDDFQPVQADPADPADFA